MSPKAAIIQANDEATVANREKMLADVERLSRQMLASVGKTRAKAEVARRLRVFMLQTIPASAIVIGGLLAVALLRRRKARQQKKRYDVALNNMPQGICMSNRNGVVTVANQRLRKMFEMDAEPSGLTVEGLAEEIATASGLEGGENIAFVENLSRHFNAQDFDRVHGRAGRAHLRIPLQQWTAATGSSSPKTSPYRPARVAQDRTLAMFDALTGLPNRAQFSDRLHSASSKCGDHGVGSPFSASISMCSRRSTTRSATRWATSCFGWSPGGLSPACAKATWSRVSAATNS